MFVCMSRFMQVDDKAATQKQIEHRLRKSHAINRSETSMKTKSFNQRVSVDIKMLWQLAHQSRFVEAVDQSSDKFRALLHLRR